MLPPWMPTIGIEGGRINVVPVDFVADAMDFPAHKKGLDGKCFHLTDPAPHRSARPFGAEEPERAPRRARQRRAEARQSSKSDGQARQGSGRRPG